MSLIVFACIVFTLVGVILTLKSLFPQRRGDTLYCRKCAYNLTGLDLIAEGARCPECGAVLTKARAIIAGERHIRVGPLVLGLLILIFGVLPLGAIVAGSVLHVDWYKFKPTGWVLADIGSNNDTLAAKALAEVNRRNTARPLDTAQLHRLVKLCLTEQSRQTTRGDVTDAALNTLYALYRTGQLSEEEADQFFTNMVRCSLELRRRVAVAQPTTATIMHVHRGPNGRLSVRVRLGQARLDDAEVARPGGTHAAVFSLGATGRIGSTVSFEHPGEYTFSQDVTVEIVSAAAVAPTWGGNTALHTREFTLTAPIEVLAASPADLIKLTHTPESDKTIAAAVEIYGFRTRPDVDASADRPLTHVQGMVSFKRPRPLNLVFDVIALCDGRELALGSVTMPKDDGVVDVHGVGVHGQVAAELPERVTIILRASQTTALQQTQFEEIWDGELRFEGVRVQREDDLNMRHGYAHFAPTYVGRVTP